MLDDKNILSKHEEQIAKIHGIFKYYEEKHEFYHDWAEIVYRHITESKNSANIRTIARLVGSISEFEEDFYKLLHSHGVKFNTYEEILHKDLLGLIILSNGVHQNEQK